MSLFPEKMLNTNQLTMDGIKAKMNYFELQAHEYHWQTTSYAEHNALGVLYNLVFETKDEILEKMMGYTGTRTKAQPVEPIKNYSPGASTTLVSEIISFAKQLEEFGSKNNMPDIENIAQGFSGEAAKVKYLLTLS